MYIYIYNINIKEWVSIVYKTNSLATWNLKKVREIRKYFSIFLLNETIMMKIIFE